MHSLDGIRAILFDIDGTLFSSEGIIGGIYRDRFLDFRTRHGRPEHIPDTDEIMAQIGKPVVKIFEALAPDLSPEERTALSEGILKILVERILNGEGHHYPNADRTIRTLHQRGYQIYAASNGRLPYVRAILEANGTLPHFKEISAIDNLAIRDKNELVAHILNANGIEPQSAAMIGDRFSDRDAAIKNGCVFVACRFGHGNEKEWEGATAYIDTIDELLGILP
jgi:phosphoglycolate phosphatase